MSDVNVLIQEAEQAIEFIEDTDARKILKQLRQIVVTQKIKETDPSLFSRLEKLMVYLSIVAFPNLSDQESAEVLRNYYLESYDIGVLMENRITAKLFFVPYLVRDEPRELLKKALLANNQKIGDLTLGQWIQEFEKQFSVKTRSESAPLQFMTDNSKVRGLSPLDQKKLKEILHTYDYLLVSTLPAVGEDLKNLMSVVSRQKGAATYELPMKYSKSYSVPSSQRESAESVVTVSLPLLPALSKYENLGNQLITNERIRVKSQQEPVRPSLLYWLKYYRDELGIGQHNSVERGDFLFRSENGRKLSPDERERISLILKSLEENLPLSIDTERQEIIFPIFQGVLVPPHQPEPLQTATPFVRRANNDFGGEKSTVPPVETPKRPAFQNLTFFSPVQGDSNDLSKKERTDQTRSSESVGHNTPALRQLADTHSVAGGGGMSFSTGHIFPAEKEVIVKKSFRPAPTKKAFDDSNPFIINPSRGGEE